MKTVKCVCGVTTKDWGDTHCYVCGTPYSKASEKPQEQKPKEIKP